MRISQSEYYQKQQLHPDRLEIEDKKVFARYHDIRKNLYQNLLNIPLSLLSGHDVLEVGCGTGESSTILALYGARITIVDNDPTVAQRLNFLFKKLRVDDCIRRMTFCDIRMYEDEQNFSLVTAEGFLFTMPDREDVLRKLCNMIKPGGFCIISFPEPFGTFLEFVKKTVMWRALQIAGIYDIYSQASLDIAWQLFEKAYMKLPIPREFSIWWKDCIVSPFLTLRDCWTYDNIIALISHEQCSFYSSIPRIYEPSHLSWYKSISSTMDQNEAILRSYAARRFDFLFGEPVGVSQDSPLIGELTESLNGILDKLSHYFYSLEATFPSIDFAPIVKLFEYAGVKHTLIPELAEFFDIIHTESLKTLIDGYYSLKNLSVSWGNSYHYFCFIKDTRWNYSG